MTGRDWLNAELMKKGATSAQCNSKIVAMILEVLSEHEPYCDAIADAMKELYAATIAQYNALAVACDKQASEYAAAAEKYRDKYRRRDMEIEEKESELSRGLSKLNSEKEELEKQRAMLNECETAEARDCIRKAKFFRNSTDVDSKYDNTAYIRALGAILAGYDPGAADTEARADASKTRATKRF